MKIINFLLIGIGGFIGTMARYGILKILPYNFNGNSISWGASLINLIGCLLLGIFIGLMEIKTLSNSLFTNFVIIGLIGAFTTFAALEYETFQLLQSNRIYMALLNLFINFAGGLSAIYISTTIIKKLLK